MKTIIIVDGRAFKPVITNEDTGRGGCRGCAFHRHVANGLSLEQKARGCSADTHFDVNCGRDPKGNRQYDESKSKVVLA